MCNLCKLMSHWLKTEQKMKKLIFFLSEIKSPLSSRKDFDSSYSLAVQLLQRILLLVTKRN